MAHPPGHAVLANMPMREDNRPDLPPTIDIESLNDDAIRQYTFVDVREDNERLIKPCNELTHKHFPLSGFQPETGFPADPHQQYIFFCALGQRSLMLAEYLREQQGMTNVYSLNGGIEAIKKYFRDKSCS